VVKRRDFLRYASALVGTTVVGGSLWQEALAAFPATGGPGPYGPLQAPDANGLRLPAGFSAREVARGLELVAGTGYSWHVSPDGGACFAAPGGDWIYVSNSEFLDFPQLPNSGGAGAIRFAPDGSIVDAYRILAGTILNCAGGRTPWDTWLSCEEHIDGLVWECDPLGVQPAVSVPAMGRFQHEAATADPDERRFYLTEDEPDGCFYRFTPSVWGDLSAGGLLEVAEVDAAGQVTWHAVPRPDPADTANDPTRLQVAAATSFDGGEGIEYARGHVFFTTKGDGRVWDYVPLLGRLTLIYDDDLDPAGVLTGVDNLTVAPSFDLVVAEDKGTEQQLVLIGPGGVASPLVEMDQIGSEFAGPAFSPDGSRLYVSSQRGPGGAAGPGITYEIRGPFRLSLVDVGSCAAALATP
jgi:hypothetical protein